MKENKEMVSQQEQIIKELMSLQEPKTPKQWLKVLQVMKKAGFKTWGEENLINK
jgi:hypothetical protein